MRGARCKWLLLALACEAAPNSGPTHDFVLTPNAKSNDDPNSVVLNQKDLGDVPDVYPHPPPTPPMVPALPKAPFDMSYWPAGINYSDPNFVMPEPATLCDPVEMEHSNRTGAAKCMDRLTPFPAEGTECFYECEPGYIALGRHICQWHDFDWIAKNSINTDKDHNRRGWLSAPSHKYSFYGGRCQKMCGELADQQCPIGQSPRRYPLSMMTSNITDAHAMHEEHEEHEEPRPGDIDPYEPITGEHTVDCMETECFPTAKDNLWNIAKGVYDVMQIARDRMTGVYYNEVNLDWFVRYMERTHSAEYTVDNGSPVDSCMGQDWSHEALEPYPSSPRPWNPTPTPTPPLPLPLPCPYPYPYP